MTNQEIFSAALALLSESMVEGDADDYEERAPYLIAAFCNDVRFADAALRRSMSVSPQVSFSSVFLELDEDFPLLDDFASPAALYLAAMLVLEYDITVYKELFEQYSDCISRVCTDRPAALHAITDVYGF